jgi:hypothetical protein
MVEPSTDAFFVTRKLVQACALGVSITMAKVNPEAKSLKDFFIIP